VGQTLDICRSVTYTPSATMVEAQIPAQRAG
jgi:hypothetical protein